MKFLVITFKGVEPFLKQEIKKITPKFTSFDNFIICDVEDKEKLLHLRSATRVIEILNEAKDFNSILNYNEKEKKAKTFSCKVISEINKENLKEDFIQSRKIKLRYSHPDIIYYLIRTEKRFILGKDVSGDLTKRDYRIFTTRYSLNSIVAYALSQFGKTNVFITTTDGSPLIEFALTQSEPIKAFCLEKSLFNGVRKNIILSGIKDRIDFNQDLSRLKNSKFDKIVIPLNFKTTKAGVTVKRLLNLVKDSVKKELITLTLTSQKQQIADTLFEFKIKQELNLFQGKLELVLLRFQRM